MAHVVKTQVWRRVAMIWRLLLALSLPMFAWDVLLGALMPMLG